MLQVWWIARRRAAPRTAHDAVIAGTRTVTPNDANGRLNSSSRFYARSREVYIFPDSAMWYSRVDGVHNVSPRNVASIFYRYQSKHENSVSADRIKAKNVRRASARLQPKVQSHKFSSAQAHGSSKPRSHRSETALMTLHTHRQTLARCEMTATIISYRQRNLKV
jgi:hypothetical protein